VLEQCYNSFKIVFEQCYNSVKIESDCGDGIVRIVVIAMILTVKISQTQVQQAQI
jgi:hypothetical protein